MTYFHVWIDLRTHEWPGVGELDLTREELEKRVLEPYRARLTISLAGRDLTRDDIESLHIRHTDQPSAVIKPTVLARGPQGTTPIEYLVFSDGEDVTDEFLSPLSPVKTLASEPIAALPREGRAVLKTMWGFYSERKRWPSTRELDGLLHQTHGLDLVAVRSQLSPDLLWPDLSGFPLGWEPDRQEVRLTVRGLSMVAEAAMAAQTVVALVTEIARQAVHFTPASADDELVIRRDQAAEALGLQPTDPNLAAACDVIQSGVPGLWRSLGSGPDGWAITVNERGARRYAKVVSVNDLLARVDQVLQDREADLARMSQQFVGGSPTIRTAPVGGRPTPIPDSGESDAAEDAGDPHKVFVVHGRNKAAREALDEFLGSLGLEPVQFEHDAIKATRSASPYTADVLDAGFALARAVLVLLTPDETVSLRPELAGTPSELPFEYQARPNVFFELGMAFRADRRRTVIVELGNVRPFSDIGGVHVVRLDDSPESRRTLINRLSIAGCDVRPKSDDWRRAGEFLKSVQLGPHSLVTSEEPEAPSGDQAEAAVRGEVDRAVAEFPMTDQERWVFTKTITYACLAPALRIEYVITRPGASFLLGFGSALNGLHVAADGTKGVLERLVGIHQGLLAQCKVWPIWSRIRHDPGA